MSCDFDFFIFWLDPPQLFDLASDPDEMQTLDIRSRRAYANISYLDDKMAHFI